MATNTILSTTTADTGVPVVPIDVDARPATVQATVRGTGSVSATVIIEVSNDLIGWIPIQTLALSGSVIASDGFVLDAAWGAIRARCTTISGTGARTFVTVGV